MDTIKSLILVQLPIFPAQEGRKSFCIFCDETAGTPGASTQILNCVPLAIGQQGSRAFKQYMTCIYWATYEFHIPLESSWGLLFNQTMSICVPQIYFLPASLEQYILTSKSPYCTDWKLGRFATVRPFLYSRTLPYGHQTYVGTPSLWKRFSGPVQFPYTMLYNIFHYCEHWIPQSQKFHFSW